ncbi:hypothetical protein G6F57_021962 [Rhizopus arrhizus]|nr:hypothetical protein G6F57_021962 [Rhizopus arrhizus]
MIRSPSPVLPHRLSAAVLSALSLAIAPAAFADAAADPTTLDKVVVKGERAEGYSVRRTSAATSASKTRSWTTSSTCWPTPPA